jgi:hypothetical protein
MDTHTFFPIISNRVLNHEFPVSIKKYKVYDLALAFIYLSGHPIIQAIPIPTLKYKIEKNIKEVIKYRFRTDNVSVERTGIKNVRETIIKLLCYRNNNNINIDDSDKKNNKLIGVLKSGIELLEKKYAKTPSDILKKQIDIKIRSLNKLKNESKKKSNEILINNLHINGIGKHIYDIYKGSPRDELRTKICKIDFLNKNFNDVINEITNNNKPMKGYDGPDNSGDNHSLKNKKRDRTFKSSGLWKGTKNQSVKQKKEKIVKPKNNSTYVPPMEEDVEHETKESIYRPPGFENENVRDYNKSHRTFDNNNNNHYNNNHYNNNRHNNNNNYVPKHYRTENKYVPKHYNKKQDGFISLSQIKKKGLDLSNVVLPSLIKKSVKKSSKVMVIEDKNNSFDALINWGEEEDDTSWNNVKTNNDENEMNEEEEEIFETTQFENKFVSKAFGKFVIYDYTKRNNEYEENLCEIIFVVKDNLEYESEVKEQNFSIPEINDSCLSRNKFYGKYILKNKERKQKIIKPYIVLEDNADPERIDNSYYEIYNDERFIQKCNNELMKFLKLPYNDEYQRKQSTNNDEDMNSDLSSDDSEEVYDAYGKLIWQNDDEISQDTVDEEYYDDVFYGDDEIIEFD